MSKVGRPRVHLHLSRETIAQAGLALIDRDGLEALSLRNLAVELGVGTTTLYGHVRTREEIVSDIVGLLLREVDTTERPDEGWDDGLRRVAHAVREMALHHPRAFPLVAAAPVDEPPVLDYARSLASLRAAHGMTQAQFVESWKVVDGFLTGFLLMETAAVVRSLSSDRIASDAVSPPDRFQRLMAGVHSAKAFATALEVIIAGLRQTQTPLGK
jgi:AcrR family transcriptional regulator